MINEFASILVFSRLVPKYPYEANKVQQIGLIAGGTGIAPMVR
jgi:ferredoxin-NADP reductase